jgi:hypothetical protein
MFGEYEYIEALVSIFKILAFLLNVIGYEVKNQHV